MPIAFALKNIRPFAVATTRHTAMLVMQIALVLLISKALAIELNHRTPHLIFHIRL